MVNILVCSFTVIDRTKFHIMIVSVYNSSLLRYA